MRVRLGLAFEHFVLDLVGELAFDDKCEHLSFFGKLLFNGNIGQYFSVKAMHLTNFKSKSISNFELPFPGSIINDFGNGLIIALQIKNQQ